MRSILILSSFLFFTAACAPTANEPANSTPNESSEQTSSLLDVASPEEVAAELGLPDMADSSVPEFLSEEVTRFAIEQHNATAGIDVTKYFPVVIVINKAAKGPTAQTMKVYHRGQLAHTFAVSTGRETEETATKSGRNYFSTTPTGWYAPTRTYEKYHSTLWQADMNNSVFFNGGIAMHATTRDHYKELGSRASGGCVRLHPTNAKIVYDLVLAEGKGEVPVYTRTGQVTIEGFWKKKVKMAKNWNTLIIVEDTEL
ncbi:MAG: murein L,D-transpeptidase [Proteobacteria bacterium]|nr:MAG: murein L,D-transpeptidase [Pseudomonadota bacterium]